MASFRAGRTDIVFATAHVRWGKSGEAGRLGEVVALAEWAKNRAARLESNTTLVLAGDLNVPSTRSPLYRALEQRGLRVPSALVGSHGTSLDAEKRYDQIMYAKDTATFSERAGAVDFYRGEHGGLFPRRGMSKPRFTREISDHLPLWAEMWVG